MSQKRSRQYFNILSAPLRFIEAAFCSNQYMPPIETRKTRNEHIKRELGKNQNNKGKREHLTRDTPWAATRKST